MTWHEWLLCIGKKDLGKVFWVSALTVGRKLRCSRWSSMAGCECRSFMEAEKP